LDPDTNVDFWDFSFQEMADYDLPALFDLVLEKTGVPSVSYIGHSQGTQQLFAALIDNPEYFNPKVNVAIMLAPVARIDRLTSEAVHKLKDFDNLFEYMENKGPEIMPHP
jgi:pimeloyl-ACP methyl ester carboxylesterase